MDHLKVRKLDENAFDKIFYKNRVYDYAMGYERFIDTLCQSFPHEKENLRQYTTLLKEVGNLISVDNLKKGIISTEGMKFFNTSAAGMIVRLPPILICNRVGRLGTSVWWFKRTFQLL